MYGGIPFSVDSIEDAAIRLFGLKAEISDNGRDWDIIVNGVIMSHYLRSDVDSVNGYTKAEALKNYMRNFAEKHTYENLHWYQLMDNSK